MACIEHARILGSLKGVATGDAIGKQTETLSREAVVRWYPDGVRGFEGTPGTTIPRYVGNARREWLIGETTDDTERTIAVARAILEDGEVCHATVGRELLSCRKSVHPSVKSLWEFHKAGDPARVAQCHEGCGAAIRVAPVGALYSSERLEEIIAAAYEASISTHGGALALAAAAATAAAVSAAIDGASASGIVGIAEEAASRVEQQRSGSVSVAGAIRGMHVELSRWTTLEPNEVAAAYFPRTPLTVVPLAIALATILESAEAAILLAANVGGDSDSVASIAGAILGARCPETINGEWYAVVESDQPPRSRLAGGRSGQASALRLPNGSGLVIRWGYRLQPRPGASPTPPLQGTGTPGGNAHTVGPEAAGARRRWKPALTPAIRQADELEREVGNAGILYTFTRGVRFQCRPRLVCRRHTG